MAHTPYHFDWNQSPTGGPVNPSGSYTNPTQFLKNFADINVSNLDESSMAFLPSLGSMQTEIGQARTGLGMDMTGQRLTGTQNLLGMTGGQGLAGAYNSGFGRSQYGLDKGLGGATNAYGLGLQGSMADYQGNVLDAQYGYQDRLTTALSNLLTSGEDDFQVSMGSNAFDPNNPTGGGLQNYSMPPATYQGAMINVNGSPWYWNPQTNSYEEGYKGGGG